LPSSSSFSASPGCGFEDPDDFESRSWFEIWWQGETPRLTVLITAMCVPTQFAGKVGHIGLELPECGIGVSVPCESDRGTKNTIVANLSQSL
jgi:hypothetical protein